MFQELTPYVLFAQAVGFVAFFMGLVSYQFKSQRTMFGIRVSADFIWTVHYALLGAVTPAITVGIAFIRTFLAVFIWPKYKKVIVLVAISAVLCVCLVGFNGAWQNLLPALTAVFYGLSTYFHEDYIKSRLFMAIGALFWVLIGFIFGSYAEVISSSISFVSILVGYGRHRRSIHIKA